ncbi:MAG: hypothetical protein AAGA56_14860, partial [Myxococcota bacterium]
MMHASRRLLLLGSTLAIVACSGQIGGRDDGQAAHDGPGSTVSGEDDFVCDPDAVPAAVPLRRLSQAQYRNTIGDLISVVAPTLAEEVLEEIEPEFAALVDDQRVG